MWAWSTGLPSQCVNILLTAIAHKQKTTNHHSTNTLLTSICSRTRTTLVAHVPHAQWSAHHWNNRRWFFLADARLHVCVPQVLVVLEREKCENRSVIASVELQPSMFTALTQPRWVCVCNWIWLSAQWPTFRSFPDSTLAYLAGLVYPRHACRDISYNTARLRQVALNTPCEHVRTQLSRTHCRTLVQDFCHMDTTEQSPVDPTLIPA